MHPIYGHTVIDRRKVSWNKREPRATSKIPIFRCRVGEDFAVRSIFSAIRLKTSLDFYSTQVVFINLISKY